MSHFHCIVEEQRLSSDTAVIMHDVLLAILFPMYAFLKGEMHVDADAVRM